MWITVYRRSGSKSGRRMLSTAVMSVIMSNFNSGSFFTIASAFTTFSGVVRITVCLNSVRMSVINSPSFARNTS
jgi:hypothetical protein